MAQLTRRLILGALPALSLAGRAFAEPLVAEQQPPAPEDNAGDKLDSWVDMYGRPTAKVMVNEIGPFQFMVDTGSNTSVIAARHMATLGANQLGEATVFGTTGSASMPLVRLDSLQTGSVTKLALDVAVLPDTALVREDGILGADVFAGRKLSFDIRGRSVRVEPSRRLLRAKTMSNMQVRNGLLAEIHGRVGLVATRLMLDTGSQSCIANMALNEALLQRHPKLKRNDDAWVSGVTGQRVAGQYVALPTVDLRAFTVRDAGCVAADASIFHQWGLTDEPAMIVGVDLLSRLDSFSIDYGARMFDVSLIDALFARNPVAFG